MAKPVKKRAYKSVIRQEHAARTRTRILDVARALFEEKGYGRTTIRDIAEGADVAIDTVYTVIGPKPRVLTALIDQGLAPPGGATSVTERPQAHAVRDERDQRRQLHLFAADMAALSTRVRPIVQILRTAAAVEPEMADIQSEMEGYRLRNMTQVAKWLAANGPLRVSTAKAGQIIWTLASPDVGRMLCDAQGWTEAQHAAWLEDVLIRTLLPDAPTRRRRR